MAKIDTAKTVETQVEEVSNVVELPTTNGGITIEDNVPMPESVRTGGKAKYPWAELKEGQSFFIAGAKVETFYTLCSTASKKHKCKFIARKWDGEGGVKGVRVWRTKG
jgi:hypothetical protein